MTDDIHRRSFLKLAGTGALAATGTGTATASGSLTRSELRDAARQDVASETSWSASDLTVVVDTKVTYPTIDETYYRAKLLAPDGDVHASALDDADGSPVDLESVEQQEHSAYEQQFGKKTPELAARVDSAAEGEQIEIGIWHAGADRTAAKEAIDYQSIEDENEARRQLSEELTERIESKSQTIADALGAMSGADVEEVGTGEARVGAMATPSAIASIEGRSDVTKLFLAEYPEAIPFLGESSKTHGTYAKRNGDYNAAGYRVGVWGLQGYPLGHDLNVGGSRRTFSSAPKDTHADLVALSAASTDDNRPGTAHDADVYCAMGQLFTDSKMSWFADWSRRVGAVNLSWGLGFPGRLMREPDFRFSDYSANHFVNIVISAGNEPDLDSYIVSTPAKGFNQITVGATDNEDTGYNDGDDQISTYSCWKDPITKHAWPNWNWYPMDKPELSAVGNPTQFPAYTGSAGGTSFSAPQVAGLATLLQRFADDNGRWINFSWFPEAVRSILMVSATNTGDSSYDYDEMGTGAIEAGQAEQVVANGWFETDLFFKNNNRQTYTFNAQDTDSEVRVALSWLTESAKSYSFVNGNPSNAQSDLDLDVWVEDPNGNYVGGSWDFDTGCEYFSFDPSWNGTYTVTVSNYRWDPNDYWRYVGLAWNRL